MAEQELIEQNENLLANAVELGFLAIKKIAGNALSDELGGGTIDVVLRQILAAKLNTHFQHHQGEPKQ